MTDKPTSFDDAMRTANEESLDDLAHYRPNRHGAVDLDCFGKGYRTLDPSEVPPIEVRKYPEDGCPRQCTQCQTPFLFGQIIHPELDGTRCIPCFKVNYRKGLTGLAAAFKAAAGDGPHELPAWFVETERALQRARLVQDLFVIIRDGGPLRVVGAKEAALRQQLTADGVDVDAQLREMAERDAHPGARLLGKQLAGQPVTEEDLRAYAEWMEKTYGPLPDVSAADYTAALTGLAGAWFKPVEGEVGAAAVAIEALDGAREMSTDSVPEDETPAQHLARLRAQIDANAVARCHKCGKATANPDQIGAACSSGMMKDPAERCRGYMHPVEETLRNGYFKA